MVEHWFGHITLDSCESFQAQPVGGQTVMQFIDTPVNFFEHVGLTQCRLEVAPELWRHLAVKLLL